MISVLSESDFQATAEPALRRIFIKEDPYDEPFAPQVQQRRLVFEYMYEMRPPLRDAIIHAATLHGEHGFYVSIFDRPPESEQRQPYHWYIPFSDIASSEGIVGPLQNFAYSPQGTWGIMGTFEDYGFLGGDTTIITVIERLIPDLHLQVFQFFEHWEWEARNWGAKVYWVPDVIRHVYGPEQAAELLRSWNPQHPTREQ